MVDGDKVRRKWDQAQTPYQRLLATGMLSPEQQERLQALYEQTNPLLLREESYASLAALWDAALATAGQPPQERKEGVAAPSTASGEGVTLAPSPLSNIFI